VRFESLTALNMMTNNVVMRPRHFGLNCYTWK